MKTPAGLQPLIDDGVIDEVVRSLKSGKEATVYVVRSRTALRCAKVYRDMGQRSFQKRAQYQEGRNSPAVSVGRSANSRRITRENDSLGSRFSRTRSSYASVSIVPSHTSRGLC